MARAMRTPPAHRPAAPVPDQGAADASIWIVSRNRGLIERIRDVLRGGPASVGQRRIEIVDPAQLEKEAFRAGRATPKLILLDIDADAQWGGAMIRCLRRPHPTGGQAWAKTPVVILTKTFTREFGQQVISAGIRYYLSHDFCDEEFIELVRVLTA